MAVVDYMDKLYTKLNEHITANTKPKLKDKAVATLASRGPAYSSLDEVQEETEKRRRGLVTKPHYLTTEELDIARQRTEKAKKAAAKQQTKKT